MKQRIRSLGALFLLGFSSGLPLALSGASLQAWLTVEGVDLATIGLLAMAGTPYTFKFVWAPLLDRFYPRFADHRRSWLVLMQLSIAATLFAMAFNGVSNPLVVGLLACLLSTFSATQDIAFDAYRTELLPAKDRGLGAAWAVFGYRMAMLTSGGLALIAADRWFGWQATYAGLGVLCIVLSLITLSSPSLINPVTSPQHVLVLIKQSWRNYLNRDGALLFLLLIILYKLGDAFAGSLSTSFLIRGLGFTATDVGLVNKALGLVATIAGALCGGALLSKIGLYRSLLLFGILQAVSNLCFWYLSISTKSMVTMSIAIAIENLCGGMGTAAFVALLTGLCSAQFSASQYALLSALASFGRVYLTAPSGFVVQSIGWSSFFILSVLLALPGLVLLMLMKKQVQSSEANDAATTG